MMLFTAFVLILASFRQDDEVGYDNVIKGQVLCKDGKTPLCEVPLNGIEPPQATGAGLSARTVIVRGPTSEWELKFHDKDVGKKATITIARYEFTTNPFTSRTVYLRTFEVIVQPGTQRMPAIVTDVAL